jgi:hypothetical protein
MIRFCTPTILVPTVHDHDREWCLGHTVSITFITDIEKQLRESATNTRERQRE